MRVGVADILGSVGNGVAIQYVARLRLANTSFAIGKSKADLETGEDVDYMGRMHMGVFLGAFFEFEIEHAHSVVVDDDLVVVRIKIQGVLSLTVSQVR